MSAGEWKGDWIGKADGGEINKWTDYTADVDFDIKDLAIGVFLRRQGHEQRVHVADLDC